MEENWIVDKDYQKLYGTNYDDKLGVYGTRSHTSVYGGAGDDDIFLREGKYDIVFAGDGDDTVKWEPYADWLMPKQVSVMGGAGNDYLDVDGGTSIGGDSHLYLVAGGDGDDTIFGSDAEDSIYGNAGNDYIVGNDDSWSWNDTGDVIVGCEGNDTILAGAGDDQITGDAADIDASLHGSDVLYGDTGNDSLWGNAGDDSLGGGTGADWLYGGQGNDKLWGSYIGDDKEMDVFVFRTAEGQQVDEVMDFESGFDGVWCQDGAFTKAEIHGNDLWAYAGDDRGMIIHNAVGKVIKWANSDGKINVFKVG